MINPFFCGISSEYHLSKNTQHDPSNSNTKSFAKSQGSNHSSQKEKKSLRCITNNQTKQPVKSQFKKEVESLIIDQRTKDETKLERNKFENDPSGKKTRYSFNEYFSLKENRRKFESLYYRPSEKQNNISHHAESYQQKHSTNSNFFSKILTNKNDERVMEATNLENYNKSKNLKIAESQIINREISKSTTVPFLHKPIFVSDEKNKFSLKPHFSVAHLKSQSFELLQDSKVAEKSKSSRTPSFLKNPSRLESTKMSENVDEDEEKDENKMFLNKNSVSMSRFFSLKSSRFFTPKNQESNKKKQNKEINEELDNENYNFHKKNEKEKENVEKEEKGSSMSDSTRVSTFFESDNWNKREIENRFIKNNDSFQESKFGFNSEGYSNQNKKTNENHQSSDSHMFKFEELFKADDERNNEKEKNGNVTLTKNFSMKNSFLSNTPEPQKSILIDNSNETKANKIERNIKQRPSFFVDFESKNSCQQKELKKWMKEKNNSHDETPLLSAIEVKDAESIADSEFNNSEKDSELEYVLHSTDKIQLKSFAFLSTLESDKTNFLKYK